jgi:predicted nicotinamide N-methyase
VNIPAMKNPEAFVLANTAVVAPSLVPEIRLHLASEALPLWQMTEDALSATGLPPPYWAFAWAGGQALARHLLDHPDLVRGKRVIDFACGGGIAAIAAARAGAAEVTAVDIDPLAVATVRLNAALNDVTVATDSGDWIGRTDVAADIIVAGDICYEQPLARRVEEWLGALARRGLTVMIGDPGRTYLPKTGIEALAVYRVETSRDLEDTDIRRTTVWRVIG